MATIVNFIVEIYAVECGLSESAGCHLGNLGQFYIFTFPWQRVSKTVDFVKCVFLDINMVSTQFKCRFICYIT